MNGHVVLLTRGGAETAAEVDVEVLAILPNEDAAIAWADERQAIFEADTAPGREPDWVLTVTRPTFLTH